MNDSWWWDRNDSGIFVPAPILSSNMSSYFHRRCLNTKIIIGRAMATVTPSVFGTISGNISQDHDWKMIDWFRNCVCCVITGSWLPPNINASITMQVKLAFVTKNNIPPFLGDSVPAFSCPLQPLLSCCWWSMQFLGSSSFVALFLESFLHLLRANSSLAKTVSNDSNMLRRTFLSFAMIHLIPRLPMVPFCGSPTLFLTLHPVIIEIIWVYWLGCRSGGESLVFLVLPPE